MDNVIQILKTGITFILMKKLRTISKTITMLLALQFAGLSVVSANEFGNDFYKGGHAKSQNQSELNWLNTFSQKSSASLRSRSEVMSEVKRRKPNARILKISLSQNGRTYKVKIIDAGVVEIVRVNALR